MARLGTPQVIEPGSSALPADPNIIVAAPIGKKPTTATEQVGAVQEGLQGVYDTVGNVARRVTQGIYNIPFIPGQILNNIYQGADAALRAGPEEEALPGADYLKGVSERVDNSMRQASGAPIPDNMLDRTLETAAPMALQMAIPGGAAALATNPIVGAVLPGVQSTSLWGLLAELGLTYGAQEGMTELANPDAKTAVDVVAGDSDVIVAPPIGNPEKGEIDQLTEEGVGANWQRYRTAQVVGGALSLLGIGALGASAIQGSRNKARQAQVAAQNPFAGEINNPVAKSTLQQEDLTGVKVPSPTNASLLDKGIRFAADTQHPIEVMLDAAEKQGSITPDVRARLSAQKDVTRYQAMVGMVEDFVKTGRFPFSKIKAQTPLFEIGKRIERLAPDEQAALERLVTAETKLDTMANSLAKGVTNPKSYKWGTWDYGSLRAEAQTIRQQFPHLGKMADEWQSTMTASLDWALERGLISKKLHAELKTVNPHYMPLMANTKGPKWEQFSAAIAGSDQVGTKGVDLGDLPFLKTRGGEDQLPPGSLKNPFDASVEYFQKLIRYGMINDLNARLAKVAMHTRMDGVPLMQPTKLKGAPIVENALYRTIRFHGKPVTFKVNDMALYSALAHRPRYGFNGLTAAANFKAFWLTGAGNPSFVLKQYGYETIGGMLNRPSGTRFGLVDPFFNYAPKSFIGKHARDILYSIDPTQLAAMPVGALKRFYSDLLFQAWTNTKVVLTEDPKLQSLVGAGNAAVGKQRLEALAELMRYGYERSAYANMSRSGAGHVTMFQAPWQRTDITDSLQALKRYQGYTHVPIYEHYKYVLHAIKEGARLQYFSANQAKEWRASTVKIGNTSFPVFGYLHNKDDIITNLKAAAKTRELTGDPGRHGGDVASVAGRRMQSATNITLYGNVAIQGMSSTIKAIKDHPTRYFATLTGMMAAGYLGYSEWAQSPEGRDAISQMTPEQRAKIIPFAIGGKVLFGVTIPQEVQPAYGAALHALLGNEGMLKWSDNEEGDIWRVVSDVLQHQVAPSGPLANPILSVAANTLGYSPNQSGWGLQEIRSNPLDAPEVNGTFKDILAEVIDSVFGASSLITGEAGKLLWNGIEQKNSEIDPKYKPDWFEVGTLPALKYQETLMRQNPGLWGINPSTPVAGFAYQKIKASQPQIEAILKKFSAARVAGSSTTLSGNSPDLMDFIPQGSSKDIVLGSMTYALERRLKPLIDERSQVQKRLNEIEKAAIGYSPEGNISLKNSYNAQKQRIDELILDQIRSTERTIAQTLGEEFTYETYRP